MNHFVLRATTSTRIKTSFKSIFSKEPHYQGASICIVPDQQVGSGDTVLNYGLVSTKHSPNSSKFCSIGRGGLDINLNQSLPSVMST